MSLVHGGASFRILRENVYQFMSGKDAADMIVGIDEVPDIETRQFLLQVINIILIPLSFYIHNQIKDVKDVEGFRQLANDNFELLIECGISKPPSTLNIDDKTNIIQAITLHKVVLGTMAELSQFKKGLSVFGCVEETPRFIVLLLSLQA